MKERIFICFPPPVLLLEAVLRAVLAELKPVSSELLLDFVDVEPVFFELLVFEENKDVLEVADLFFLVADEDEDEDVDN